MLPLGRSERDEEVAPEQIESFWTDHYGLERARLVAVGDVSAAELGAAVRRAIDGATFPATRRSRRERDLRVDSGVRVQLRSGTRGRISAARAFRSLDVARGFVEALPLREAESRLGSQVTASSFALRGGAVVILRASWTGNEAAALTYELTRFDGLPDSMPPLPEEQPGEIAHRAAYRWLTEDAHPRSIRGTAIGIGVVDLEGRSDASSVQAAGEQGVALSDPPLDGSASGETADVTVGERGPRIVARRTTHRLHATAILFSGGAASDPPRLHGRAALLAEVVAESCRYDLGGRARVRSHVDSDRWGVIVEDVSSSHLEAALSCALAPDFSTGHIGRVRRRLMAQASAPTWRLAGSAARAICPTFPGSIAPVGSRESIANVTRADLTAAYTAHRVADRTTISIVGADDADDLARRAARRSSWLPIGDGVAPLPALSPSAEPVTGETWRGDFPAAVVVYGGGGRVFARALADVLDDGFTVLYRDGGSSPCGPWSAVAVRVPEHELPLIQAHVAHARTHMNLDHAAERSEIERSEAHARASTAALVLASPPTPITRPTEAPQIEPRFVIVRPGSPR